MYGWQKNKMHEVPSLCINDPGEKSQRKKCKHLGAAEGIWQHLGAPGSMWKDLPASWSICEHQGASSVWEHLRASGNIWEPVVRPRTANVLGFFDKNDGLMKGEPR